jgi:hypothetical protein
MHGASRPKLAKMPSGALYDCWRIRIDISLLFDSKRLILYKEVKWLPSKSLPLKQGRESAV